MDLRVPYPSAPTLVIIGAGFAGVDLVEMLPKEGLNIVVLDKHNYHTFQPLLYQVATGGLDAGSIAYPLRKVFNGRKNLVFRMAEVVSIETDAKQVLTSIGVIGYDYLVLATGSEVNFFGNTEVERYSFPLKSVPNAIDLRSAILLSLEKAISARAERDIERYTTFVIVGGGATGVELAGALSELRRVVIPSDYPELAERGFKIILVEGGSRLLGGMSESSSREAEEKLRRMGVELILDCRVKKYDGEAAVLENGREIMCDTLVWAAGVKGKLIDGLPLNAVVPGAARIKVDEFNRVVGSANLFAIGDVALMEGDPAYPAGHPQVAPVAKQQGRLLAKNVVRLVSGKPLEPFRYHDKGSLAVIGRNKAVADFGRWSFRGFFAWVLWLLVHVVYLIGFRNKLYTVLDWAWNYVSYDRFVRLILRPVKRPPKEFPTRA